MNHANESFKSARERFLQNNLLVVSESLQSGFFSKVCQDRGFGTDQTKVDETHFAGVWEIDLVRNDRLFTSVRAKGTTTAPPVYEVKPLRRFEKEVYQDDEGRNRVNFVPRKVTFHTTKLLAYYCPWSPDRCWSVTLGDDADFFVTATLNGCTVAVEGGATPSVTHANYVDAHQIVDQARIDHEVGLRHSGATPATVQKADYTNVRKKTAAATSGDLLDYLATVVGFRDKKTGWHFFYQSYKKFQANGATSVNVVLRDRAVPLV